MEGPEHAVAIPMGSRFAVPLKIMYLYIHSNEKENCTVTSTSMTGRRIHTINVPIFSVLVSPINLFLADPLLCYSDKNTEEYIMCTFRQYTINITGQDNYYWSSI
jgi:hypothetical protein